MDINSNTNIIDNSNNNNNNVNTTTIAPTPNNSTNTTPNKKGKLNIVQGAPEIVFFCGPPCVGKTYYYYQNYQNTHVRISAHELFMKHNDINIRYIVYNYVIKNLLDGKNVVIDDMNHRVDVRESYISTLVKEQVPISATILYNFIPCGGDTQLKWAESWGFSERCLSNSLSIAQFQPMNLTQFKAEYQVPKRNEGFTYVKDITTPLIYNTHNQDQLKQFVNSALFLDARSLFQFNLIPSSANLRFKYKVSLNTQNNIVNIIQEYIGNPNSNNSAVRIIILVDEVSLYPASIDVRDSGAVDYYRREVKKLIKSLSDQIGNSLYYYITPYVNSHDNDFFRFPNYGILAYAQHRHRISLDTSLFVVDDSDVGLISNTPVNICIASKFFQQNTAFTLETRIKNNLIENSSNLPAFLLGIQFESYDDINGYTIEKGLPLFNRVYSRENTNELSTIEEHLNGDKIHGVYFPHCEFMKIMELKKLDIKMDQNKKGDNKDEKTDPTNSDTPITTAPTNSEEKNNQDLDDIEFSDFFDKPLSFVTPDFMIDFGIDEMSVGRGQVYYKECRLSNIDVNLISPDYSSPSIKVSANCQGTMDQPYYLYIRYRYKGNVSISPLLETHCSCPNGKKTYGKCKHVVALIYHCNSNLCTNRPPSPTPSTPTKPRILPDWMQYSPNKRTIHDVNSNHDPIAKTDLIYQQQVQNIARPTKKQLQFHSPYGSGNNSNNTSFNSTTSSTSNTPVTSPQKQTETDKFIQQLFGNSKLFDAANVNNNLKEQDKTPPSTPPTTTTPKSVSTTSPTSSFTNEFVVPRTESENQLLIFFQKLKDQEAKLKEEMERDGDEDDGSSNVDKDSETNKVKVSLKDALAAQGIQFAFPDSPITNPTDNQTTKVTPSQLFLN